MDVRPKRRWYQFTVGGLLILTTLVSLPLGWFTYQRNKAQQEQLAIDRFHKVIRDAEMAVRIQTDGKSWEEVQAQFVAAGYQPLSEHDSQETTKHRFLIRKDAWAASSGTQHQLFVDISVVRNGNDNYVNGVEAGLVGLPNIPLEQAIQDDLYPSRSAVGLCLAHAEVVEAAKDFPILKEIEITYDIDGQGIFTGTYPFGFHVTVELGKSTVDDRAGRRMYFTVESSLDPVLDGNGRPMPQGFVPSSALGEVRKRGSNQWDFTP